MDDPEGPVTKTRVVGGDYCMELGGEVGLSFTSFAVVSPFRSQEEKGMWRKERLKKGQPSEEGV